MMGSCDGFLTQWCLNWDPWTTKGPRGNFRGPWNPPQNSSFPSLCLFSIFCKPFWLWRKMASLHDVEFQHTLNTQPWLFAQHANYAKKAARRCLGGLFTAGANYLQFHARKKKVRSTKQWWSLNKLARNFNCKCKSSDNIIRVKIVYLEPAIILASMQGWEPLRCPCEFLTATVGSKNFTSEYSKTKQLLTNNSHLCITPNETTREPHTSTQQSAQRATQARHGNGRSNSSSYSIGAVLQSLQALCVTTFTMFQLF